MEYEIDNQKIINKDLILEDDLDKNHLTQDKNYNSYFAYFDELVSLYKKVQHILLVSLNDVFLENNLHKLKNDELILQTIEILKEYSYDLNKILNYNNQISQNYSMNKNLDFFDKENLFTKYSKRCEELLLSNLIEHPKFEANSKICNDKLNKIKLKSKKNYEVEKLSQYMLEIINKENIKNLIEMGCGKSYLTESILLNDDMVYIGLDKKDDLIEKSTKENKKNNIFVLNHDITLDNFNKIFETEIQTKLTKSNTKKKIMLFGLHSCGNLTSDTIKIFFQNNSFSHIVIVGCCLNLLKEYVSKDVQNSSDLFSSYINNIGYDNKGNFLEQTLSYEYDYAQVGFPLSNYSRNVHKDLFLTRTVRNASMQSFPKYEECLIDSEKNLFYKKIFYRTILQSFLEKYFFDLRNFYGFGKIDISVEANFSDYLKIVFKNLNKILKNGENKQFDKYKMLEKLNVLEEGLSNKGVNNLFISEHVAKCEEIQNILWAVYVIRLRFAKIIEYIIALDRVIFMLEKGISNVHLVKIFDESVSVRNILIYATK